jgi:nucleoside-diphosphate-sugar epimerase
MNVLVTGATGFIGSHVCRHLLSNGHPVIGYDTAPTQRRVDDLANTMELLVGDIADRGYLTQVLATRKITHVVHLAALLPESMLREHPTRALEVNGVATNGLLDAALACGVECVVYASSDGVCPTGPEENAPVQPPSIYGTLKFVNEVMARHYSAHFGLATVGLRFCVNFGPGGRLLAGEYGRGYGSGRLFRVLEAVMRGEAIECADAGSDRASWMYIKDTVRLVQLALENRTERCVINVPGTMTSLREAVAILEDELSDAGRVTFEDHEPEAPLATHYFVVDPNEARLALGYEAQWTLPDALLDYAEAVRADPTLHREP